MEIKKELKQLVKNTRFFQKRKMNSYIHSENVNRLLNEEKPIRFLLCRNPGISIESKVTQMLYMLKNINIRINPKERFQTWLDTGIYVYKHGAITDNIPPDYSVIIDNSIKELIDKYSEDTCFGLQQRRMLRGVCEYINRILEEINAKCAEASDEESITLRRIYHIFEAMKNNKAITLEEGLQRILLWSSLFWQTQHRLVGIGRLDKILANLEMPETDEEIIRLIQEFNIAIHKYYGFKSNELMGDTGQIIELGGEEPDGSYLCNRLTYNFIKASIQQRLPDPKLLLRVNRKTPNELIELAVDCISTGVGYPLFSNDEIVIPAIRSIYRGNDAYNYVTSACWEPLAYGNSLDKNNLERINFAQAFVDTYNNTLFTECTNFDSLLKLYLNCLKDELDRIINKLRTIQWEPDPLNNIFTTYCLETNKDVSQGGAKYNNYGVLGVGLGNAVNSILAVTNLVFELEKYSIFELKIAASTNFYNNDNLINELSAKDYYGTENENAIVLTRIIVDYTYNYLRNKRNFFGGLIKFGLSASNYKESGDVTRATMDGRRDGDPLGVHISSHGNNAFTSLINFASKLDYTDIRCNGNVVDFFVSPKLITDNKDKFVTFIKRSIDAGFFEMQMNVIDSYTLIAAKKNPEKYSSLIVRVWGFSAYFNDLPESYKDLLIVRALQSEGAQY